MKANLRIILFPVILFTLLAIAQYYIDSAQKEAAAKGEDVNDETMQSPSYSCGKNYFKDVSPQANCEVPHPAEWPALMQIPSPRYRVVGNTTSNSTEFDITCGINGTCPVTILVTGSNQTMAQSVANNFFPSNPNVTQSSNDTLYTLSNLLLGTTSLPTQNNFVEETWYSNIQQQCTINESSIILPLQIASGTTKIGLDCVKGLHLWRSSSLIINEELFNGSWNGKEIAGAYDFLNSNENNFNVNIWYNKTEGGEGSLTRLPRGVNLASNAYLQFLRGDGVKVLLDFVKEMPKHHPVKVGDDLATYIGEMFYSWVLLQLFPVVLSSLVYEKQQNLRIMMKMHGLGDGPYWMITYAYFALMSFIYIVTFIGFGSLIGLKFFTMNDYSIQFVFYFLYQNLQIACAFLGATFFSNVRTATVISHVCVFGSGLLAVSFFKTYVEDLSFPSGSLMAFEAFPPFALYRGIYEFAEHSKSGVMMGMDGMRWSDLSDKMNGMSEVLIIMFAEWIIMLFVAYYFDQVMSSGSGVRKHPLFFLKSFGKKPSPLLHRRSLRRQESQVLVKMEKPDVAQERERVEQLLLNPSSSHAIISDNIEKIYPGKDGNPEKYAVKGLSLAVPSGECFGMLGPNGAGKTSWISMMIGLTTPTSGTAFVQGLDIRTDMDSIYTSMGVCPQHDLLWETLTGREHLLFYGRLKNLKGSALTQAVEESLKSVNLFHGGVADKHAGKYSGGMKRRLSVAISLIGDPKVVYMDEPSTGLDPASRNSLWNVVKQAKQHRAIILTTHSMEEADVLCDRLGIFVDGRFQCIGNANELKARYGGYYVFTMTTSSNQEHDVENLVQQLSPNAHKIYHLSGTQKFELPKKEVKIADVFQAVEKVKTNLTIHAWGLVDTTLEDVFIKVARDAQTFKMLS